MSFHCRIKYKACLFYRFLFHSKLMWFTNIQDWWFLSAISQIKIFSSFSKCVGRHMEIVNWKILIVYWSERLQFILENVTSNLCEMEKSELNSSSLLKIRKYCCEKSYGHKVVIYVEVLELAQIFSHISNHLRNNKE